MYTLPTLPLAPHLAPSPTPAQVQAWCTAIMAVAASAPAAYSYGGKVPLALVGATPAICPHHASALALGLRMGWWAPAAIDYPDMVPGGSAVGVHSTHPHFGYNAVQLP